jgi:putative transposase
MVEHIMKRHNKNLMIYHIVCPAKYRRKIFSEGVEETLKYICLELGGRYEINFLEIGVDQDHVHFLIQSIPNKCISDIVTTIKSITAKELFKTHPEIKNFLWGGKFWTSGYYVNTVGQYGNLKMIENYVKNQGLPEYTQLHMEPPTLFD